MHSLSLLFRPKAGAREDALGTRGSPAAVTSPVGGRATVVVAGWVVAIPTAAICRQWQHNSISRVLHPKGSRTVLASTGECSPSGEFCGLSRCLQDSNPGSAGDEADGRIAVG